MSPKIFLKYIEPSKSFYLNNQINPGLFQPTPLLFRHWTYSTTHIHLEYVICDFSITKHKCNVVSAGDPGVQPGSCQNRKESKALTSKSASLFLQNYFPTMPVQAEACKEHSTPLMDMVATCYKSAGNVMPNFLAVNFYMVSVLPF